MNCNNCGEQIIDGSKFCPNCGVEINALSDPKSTKALEHIEATSLPKTIELPSTPKTQTLSNISHPNEKKKYGFYKFLRFIISTMLTIPVLVLLILFTVSIVSNDKLENEEVSTTDNTYTADNELVHIVSNITPSSGAVGTMIRINGSNLSGSALESAMINGHELNINAVTNDIIELNITYGAQSGNIELRFADGLIDAGFIDVIEQQKKLLLENEILSSSEAQTVSVDNIAVTIPGNAIDNTQKMRIEQIVDPKPINLPKSISSTAFSITLGDIHQFNDVITIKYLIPSNSQGVPSAAYFNEETSLWDTLPSEIIDGELLIYTDHLTDFIVFYWGKSIYSSDGYFKIHYKQNDKVSYTNSMDELAISVGNVLEKARKDYEAKIPSAYRENFTYMGFMDSMDVYIDSGYPNCKYNPITNNILLPTDFSSKTDFETVLAHELFHSYQDSVWNEINYVGAMSRSDNRWAVEALAELAAYELAFPEKNRQRTINDGVSSQDQFNTFDEVHEYSMSCYLSYLLKETNSTADELWISVASSNEYLIEYSINNFFRSQSTDFISLEDSYTKFWRDVVGNADAPEQLLLDTLFYKRTKAFKENEHSASFKYTTTKSDTIAFNMFKVSEFSLNMPIRIFNMECIEGSKNGVWSTQLSGIKKVGELNGARVPDGHSWNYSSDSSSVDYMRYAFRQGKDDLVLIGLDGLFKNELSGVTISEIQAQCNPSKVENAVVGKEYEFEFAFDDIFTRVKSVLIEIDFGDGQVIEFQKNNDTGMLREVVKHRFDTLMSTIVKCSLFDVSHSDKELISQIQIPVMVENELTLTATPNPAVPTDVVSFIMSIEEAGYTYKWDLGDGTILTKNGLSKTDHAYEKIGTYLVNVDVYGDENEQIGTAKQTVAINEAEHKVSIGVWRWSGMTFTDNGENWRFITTISFFSDGTCSLVFGTEGLENNTSSETFGIYTFDDKTNQGTVKFSNVDEGGYVSQGFTVNGSVLTLDDESYKKIQ